MTVRIAAESPLPQPVAQHHLARRQVGIGVRELLGIDRDRVVLSEGPTEERPDAEQLEQVPRRVAVHDALGLAGAGQRAGDGRRPGEALEPRGLGLVVPEIGSRDERALDIGRLQARPHERQLLGMIVRQRTNSTAFATLNIATLLPMPSARVRTITAVNSGAGRMIWRAYFISGSTSRHRARARGGRGDC